MKILKAEEKARKGKVALKAPTKARGRATKYADLANEGTNSPSLEECVREEPRKKVKRHSKSSTNESEGEVPWRRLCTNVNQQNLQLKEVRFPPRNMNVKEEKEEAPKKNRRQKAVAWAGSESEQESLEQDSDSDITSERLYCRHFPFK